VFGMGLVEVDGGERKLAVETWGDPRGYPVFLLHGTPGSRLGPKPRTFVLHQLGIRLIAYDRPGYGDSSRHAGRRVSDAAADVAAIAEALDLDRYSVVGRSGGGPCALACAALNPGVASAAALVTIAPPDAEGLDWLVGMADSNVATYTALDAMLRRRRADGPLLDTLVAQLASNANAVRRDPGSLLSVLHEDMPTVDRQVVEDAGMRRLLLLNYLSAFERSEPSEGYGAESPPEAGWLDDLVSFRTPWGFRPEDISGVPVLLWHGEHDVFSPVAHFTWLAGRIPEASAVLHPGVAHFAALAALPEILAWARDKALQNA
jgi:pimeloyl-ACP methyl ester carboxylesterase